MPDLHWTLPVAAWSATSVTKPELGFIDPMVRRRLSTLSRMALQVAHDCAHTQPEVRVVFASRHGELKRTTDILHEIEAGQPVSPNAFSLSVLNAMSGIYGIERNDRSPATAMSAGAQTLGYALLEAYAQYQTDPSTPVLLVYADGPADAIYGALDDDVQQGALAILLDAGSAAGGHLRCSVSPVDSAPAHDAPDLFATQSEAVHQSLEARRETAWRNADMLWQWGWHDRAA